jgi:phage baseplate assembly protein V
MGDVLYRLTELERRMANMLRVGTVATLDESAAKVTIAIGEITTKPLPWLTRRAGEDRDWWAPEPGEQVMVLSPGGDLGQGVVLPAIYQNNYPAPANVKHKRRVEFADGGFFEYDRQAGKMTINVVGDAQIDIGGKADVTAEGKVTLIGKGTVDIVGKDGGAVKGSVQGDCLCSFTGAPHPHISPTVKESF